MMLMVNASNSSVQGVTAGIQVHSKSETNLGWISLPFTRGRVVTLSVDFTLVDLASYLYLLVLNVVFFFHLNMTA